MDRYDDKEMRRLADEMSKAISTEIEQRHLADERKLEAVLKENGWCKSSKLITEIADYIWKWVDIYDRFLAEGVDTEFNAGSRHAYMQMIDYLAMLKNNYGGIRHEMVN